jgi:hypothetical protein
LKQRLAVLESIDERRRQAASELESQSRLLHKILDTLPAGVVVVDEKGKIVLHNPLAERILGIGAIETPPLDTVHGYGTFLVDGTTPARTDDLPVVKALRGDAVDEAEFLVRSEAIPDGMWVSVSARPIRDEKGGVRGAVVAMVDRTRRRAAERGLRMVLAATREIAQAESLEEALEAVVRQVCETTGWNYGEAWLPLPDGSTLESTMAWHGDDPRLQKFRSASRALTFRRGVGLPGRVWESKHAVWIPDIHAGAKAIFGRVELATELGLVTAAGIPILSEGQVLAVLVFYAFAANRQDEAWVDQVAHVALQLGGLIAKKRAETALRLSRQDTAAAHELLSSTVTGVNHDLRQHVAAIIGYSDLIRETQLDPKAKSYLEMIERSAKEQVEILKKEMDKATKPR